MADPRRPFLTDLAHRWAKWIVVAAVLWTARVVYVYATTDLWWRTAN